VGFRHVSVCENIVNETDILSTTLHAMRTAIENLDPKPDFALIDGNITLGFTLPAKAVVHGDAISPSIAAASILAKVTRDRICMELDKKYPQYGIAKHKGYGTKVHMDALREHGACEIYRTKFIRFLDK
jgi:ribonuclease HII